MKRQIIFGIEALLFLNLIISVGAISYGEDENKNQFYKSEFEFRAPDITIDKLITLQPNSEPENPVFGMIYLDINSRKLKFYDGFDWYGIALEKEKICNSSKDCKNWGDCINDYQTKTCLIVNEYCSKSEVIEKQDCSSENSFQEEIKKAESVENITSETSADIPPEQTPESISTGQTETPIETPTNTEETPAITGETSETPTETTSTGQTPETPTEETITGNFIKRFVKFTGKFIENFKSITAKIILGKTDESIPKELFDINFKLEEKSLSSSDKLVAMISIQNLGEKYVPARLYYTIKDKNENEVYMEFEEIRIPKDYSITKIFDSLNLNYGSYILNLKVEYSGISKEFKENFIIKK